MIETPYTKSDSKFKKMMRDVIAMKNAAPSSKLFREVLLASHVEALKSTSRTSGIEQAVAHLVNENVYLLTILADKLTDEELADEINN